RAIQDPPVFDSTQREEGRYRGNPPRRISARFDMQAAGRSRSIFRITPMAELNSPPSRCLGREPCVSAWIPGSRATPMAGGAAELGSGKSPNRPTPVGEIARALQTAW